MFVYTLRCWHLYDMFCSFLGHGVELPFVFHTAPLGGYNYTHDELILANTMVQYWTNFAHYGDPNGASSTTPSDEKQVCNVVSFPVKSPVKWKECHTHEKYGCKSSSS